MSHWASLETNVITCAVITQNFIAERPTLFFAPLIGARSDSTEAGQYQYQGCFMTFMRRSYLRLTFLLILGLQSNFVIAEILQPTIIDAPQPYTTNALPETPAPLVATSTTLPVNTVTLSTDAELALSQSIESLALRVKQLEERNTLNDALPVTQEEQDAYSVGLMVAQYANRVMTDMKMVGITLDAVVIEKGILDGIAERPQIPLPTAQTIITQLETRMANAVSQKEEATQKTLNDIAKTQNTITKGNGLVWVKKKAGHSMAKIPTTMIVEGRRYQGALFDGPREITLKNKDGINDVIKKAATLTSDNGIVELYAMASKVDGIFSLPTNIPPWDIVHFTFTASQ